MADSPVSAPAPLLLPHPATQLPWDSFPSDLQELILAHLPISEHSRLRSVSRSWLSALTSPHIRHLHRRLHPRLHPHLLLYNHAVKISACMCPPAAAAAAVTASPSAPPSWCDLPLPVNFVREWVGAGSIVCVRSHLTSNAFSVGCPFSNQWKALPNPPQTPILSKLWAVVPHTSTGAAAIAYSVVLLQFNSPSLYIDVYNSEKNQWMHRAVPKGSGKGSLVAFSSPAAYIGGLVYSVQADSRSVVTYDVQRDVWQTLEARLPENLVFQAPRQGGLIQMTPQLMQGCKGKVLLVGAAAYPSASTSGKNCSSDVSSTAASGTINIDSERGRDMINYAVVWELDWASKEWKEMTRAPLQMCIHMLEEAMELRKAALMPIKYSGHAETVVIMAAGSLHALQFDAIEEKWAWLELPPAVNCDLSLCLRPNSVEQL